MAIKVKARRIRLGVQVFFFVLITLISVNHFLAETGRALPILSSASLHALCPFGGLVSMYQYFTSGTLVKKIHESSFILMWIVFALTVLLGPVFCGWVCPLGSIQEWLGKLGKRLIKKKFNRLISYRFDRVLRYLRYVMLGWVLYATAVTAKLVFADFDPYFALFRFWTGEVAITSLIILGAVLVTSLFVERTFCKYACPYGALLGLFNLFRVFKVRRNSETCIDCGACDKNCPMNIPVSTSRIVRDPQCITCMKCTSEEFCPVDNTVELMTGRMEVTK